MRKIQNPSRQFCSRCRVRSCALLVCILLGSPAALTVRADQPPAKVPDSRVVATANNRFALDLYAKLKDKPGNLFFSPYSISTALTLVYAGARGSTASQMAGVLHFELEAERLHAGFAALIKELNAGGEKGNYQLSVANALWAQKDYKFLDAFLDLMKNNYRAGLNQVDFKTAAEGARKAINAWVEKETKGKIKDLIKPGVLDSMTRLVLTNAIYFKGNWASQFKKEQTKDEPFNLPDGKKVEVPMMHQTAEFKYTQGDGFQALELGYAGDELAMVVFLPKETDGLATFEPKLTMDNLTKWLPELRRQKVIVTLPKYEMTCEFRLDAVLGSMGMPEAFTGSADFSGMTGKRDLFLAAVLHKAFVDVNEEGTEAAAATAGVMALSAMPLPEPTPVFRADHPFVFLIRHVPSNSILFIGRVSNPKGK